MSHRIWIATIGTLLASAMVFVEPAPRVASASHEIQNTQEKVNGDAARFNARRQLPDISGDLIVWQDFRKGSQLQDLQSWWMKDLSDRSETAISIPNTAVAPPNIADGWIAWVESVETGPFSVQGDVHAKQLPDGPTVTIAAHPDFDEVRPHQDGTTVVWEDYRSGNKDIWKRGLAGGAQVRVTTDPGHETDPRVSGDTIIWVDQDLSFDNARLRGKTGTGGVFDISPSGIMLEGYNIDGNRIVWSYRDSSFQSQLYTCVLPGCVSETVTAASPGVANQFPDVSGNLIVWSRCVGDTGNCQIMSRDMSTSDPAQVIDDGLGGVNPAIDGTRVVWATTGPGAGETEGDDIYWRDLANSDAPRRANSRGMGETLGFQSIPSAAGNFVGYLAPQGTGSAGAGGFNRAYVTDLTGDRRDLEVSTFTDFSTAVSPPRISASRATWKDRRNCPQPLSDSCKGDVFQRSLDPFGPETAVTSTALVGNPPDADGSRTAWICGPTSLCLDDGGTATSFPLTMTFPTHTVDSQVRISGNVVLWAEFDTAAPFPQPGVLHALNTSTGEDSIMGAGASMPMRDPSFDISGNNVVWAHADGIFKNTTSFPCAPSCDRSSLATALNNSEFPGSVSIDGTTVVWEVHGDDGLEVRLQDLGESADHKLAPFARHPYVVGDHVFFTGGLNSGAYDVFRESISGSGGTLASDTTPPAPIPGLRVVNNPDGSATLSWSNSPAADVFGVRIMRKSGSAPTSVDDTSASIIFDGVGNSFEDTDRVPGIYYVYAAFPYDEVPNFGTRTIGAEQQETQATVLDGGTVSTGEPDPSDPVDTTVTIPPGSANTDVTVTVTEAPLDSEAPPPPSGFGFLSQTVNVELDPPSTTFDPQHPATLTLSYDDSILAPGQDETSLAVFTSDGSEWVAVPDGCNGGDGVSVLDPDPCIVLPRDTAGNTITIKTTHFSAWGIAVPPILAPVSLEVDPAGGQGDGDGSLEPGETVRLAPSWTNVGGATATAVTGTLTLASCPAGATCAIRDGAATYGTVPIGEEVSCSECYEVEVTLPSSRPALHMDVVLTETVSTGQVKVWTVHIGRSFSDVSPTTFGYRFIEKVLHSGVTAGCGGTNYCPSQFVTRWQMAIFITKSILGSATIPPSGTVPNKGPYNCISGGQSVFTDVPPEEFYCPHIHYMASQGITAGCSANAYCPHDNVTRWQMAIFIANAVTQDAGVPSAFTDASSGRSYSCTAEGAVVNFQDVPSSIFYCRQVHFLWANGVVSGTSVTPPLYSPNNLVTREQMSVFLSSGFGLEAWH